MKKSVVKQITELEALVIGRSDQVEDGIFKLEDKHLEISLCGIVA